MGEMKDLENQGMFLFISKICLLFLIEVKLQTNLSLIHWADMRGLLLLSSIGGRINQLCVTILGNNSKDLLLFNHCLKDIFMLVQLLLLCVVQCLAVGEREKVFV